MKKIKVLALGVILSAAGAVYAMQTATPLAPTTEAASCCSMEACCADGSCQMQGACCDSHK